MNVLSVFDGMSCGQIALERAGIKVDNYFASEIDKYAIQITQKNYPNTHQLGDINNWKSWRLPKIDLLIGGSPCQGFSFAGRGLNFDDPRSQLFFVYAKILKRYQKKNPDLKFLLENVRMKKEHQAVISEYLGVEPVMINSALVSAQSRKRLYWTNIGKIELPEDKGILLRDIIESGDVDRDKSYCIDHNYWKGTSEENYKKKARRQIVNLPMKIQGAAIRNQVTKRVYSPNGKSPTLNAHSGGNHESKVALDLTHYRKLTPLECERLQTVPDKYSEGVSNTQRYKMLGNGWTVDVIAHIFSYLPKS